MLRQVKPKTARSKRELDKRASKTVENTKKALFIQGSTSNKFLHDLMLDLDGLKRPDSIRFQRKNEVRPFEDAQPLEFFAEKNDTSLIVHGSHSKKRPNCLTFARTFNFQIYDMIDLLVTKCKLIDEFRKQTFTVGSKPMMVFQGSLFEEHPTYQHIKSLFLDFFRVQETLLDPAGLQHVIAVSVDSPEGIEVPANGPRMPQVNFRVYLLKTEASNTPKMPRVELEEIGPRVDFAIGRIQKANPEMEKQALKKAKQEERTKKNVETNIMGDKLGRIHVGKQDLVTLQTRKMKGLKRKYDQSSDEEGDEPVEVENDEEEIIGGGISDDDVDDDSADGFSGFSE